MRLAPATIRIMLCAALALPFGLYGWAVLLATATGHDGLIGPQFNAPGFDWAIFYTAARAWFEGNLAQIYDQIWLKQTLNAGFAHWFRMPLPWPAFHYPPTFLLLVVPFGAMGFVGSYTITQAVSLLALGGGLRRFCWDRAQFWFYAVSMVLCPALSNNVLSGQNMILVAALYLAGFALLTARPWLAGAIIGLVTFKPQFALMIPFVFWGLRAWRPLAGAALSAVVLALLSLLVFGWQIWEAWFALMLHPRHDVPITGIEWGRLWDDSIFTIATLVGASKAVANRVQAIAVLVAAACVFWAYRRPLAEDLRFAVFLAATCVASPHLSQYDLVLLALAATILIWHFVQGTQRPLALAIGFIAWLWPVFFPPRVDPVGLAMPLVVFGLIAFVLASPRKAAPA